MKKVLLMLALSLFTASFTMAQSTSKGKKQGTTQTDNRSNNGATVTNSGNSVKHSANGNSQSATKQKTSKGKVVKKKTK